MATPSNRLVSRSVRSKFPALQRLSLSGEPCIYADGPGGTQLPETVIEAISSHLRQGTANASYGGPFVTSRETADLVSRCRQSAAFFLNCQPSEVVFGPNMTSLTFAVSRAITKTLPKGSTILVTDIDHDANITSWKIAAEEVGCSISAVPVNAEGNLAIETFQQCINRNTSLVAFSLASNATGSITPAKEIISLAREFNALTYVDAVHFAAHRLVDVNELNCDFLVCSPYKFFGPHLGMLFGKQRHLQSIKPCKVSAATNNAPGSWETGTQSFEALAGLNACIDYLSSLSDGVLNRSSIIKSMNMITAHEQLLTQTFLEGANNIHGLKIYGNNHPENRTSTFGITLQQHSPAQAAALLGERNIFSWPGHFYAVNLIRSLGLEKHGGLLRLGFMHYNTTEEVEQVLEALEEIA